MRLLAFGKERFVDLKYSVPVLIFKCKGRKRENQKVKKNISGEDPECLILRLPDSRG